MAKNTGKVREFCQSGEVGTLREDLVIQNVYLISISTNMAIMLSIMELDIWFKIKI